MTRTLVVRRETLTALDPDDLRAVAGGTMTVLRTSECPGGGWGSGMYPSINRDCTWMLEDLGTC